MLMSELLSIFSLSLYKPTVWQAQRLARSQSRHTKVAVPLCWAGSYIYCSSWKLFLSLDKGFVKNETFSLLIGQTNLKRANESYLSAWAGATYSFMHVKVKNKNNKSPNIFNSYLSFSYDISRKSFHVISLHYAWCMLSESTPKPLNNIFLMVYFVL